MSSLAGVTQSAGLSGRSGGSQAGPRSPAIMRGRRLERRRRARLMRIQFISAENRCQCFIKGLRSLFRWLLTITTLLSALMSTIQRNTLPRLTRLLFTPGPLRHLFRQNTGGPIRRRAHSPQRWSAIGPCAAGCAAGGVAASTMKTTSRRIPNQKVPTRVDPCTPARPPCGFVDRRQSP